MQSKFVIKKKKKKELDEMKNNDVLLAPRSIWNRNANNTVVECMVGFSHCHTGTKWEAECTAAVERAMALNSEELR